MGEQSVVQINKVTTKSGDDGTTQLGRGRAEKDHPAFILLGDLDELNATLGLAYCLMSNDSPMRVGIHEVQQRLFDVGSEIFHRFDIQWITEREIEFLETFSNKALAQLSNLPSFVLPGATLIGSYLYQSRAITRRAERHLVYLRRVWSGPINSNTLAYLNRLSDFLFIAARYSDIDAQERLWGQRPPVFKQYELDLKNEPLQEQKS